VFTKRQGKSGNAGESEPPAFQQNIFVWIIEIGIEIDFEKTRTF